MNDSNPVSTTAGPRKPLRRKLPARHAGIVMPVPLSVFMTFVASLISTLRGVGPAPGFLGIWLSAWAPSWIVAFPTLPVVLPVVRRLTTALVAPPTDPHG